jgi:hypothetical protein
MISEVKFVHATRYRYLTKRERLFSSNQKIALKNEKRATAGTLAYTIARCFLAVAAYMHMQWLNRLPTSYDLYFDGRVFTSEFDHILNTVTLLTSVFESRKTSSQVHSTVSSKHSLHPDHSSRAFENRLFATRSVFFNLSQACSERAQHARSV